MTDPDIAAILGEIADLDSSSGASDASSRSPAASRESSASHHEQAAPVALSHSGADLDTAPAPSAPSGATPQEYLEEGSLAAELDQRSAEMSTPGAQPVSLEEQSNLAAGLDHADGTGVGEGQDTESYSDERDEDGEEGENDGELELVDLDDMQASDPDVDAEEECVDQTSEERACSSSPCTKTLGDAICNEEVDLQLTLSVQQEDLEEGLGLASDDVTSSQRAADQPGQTLGGNVMQDAQVKEEDAQQNPLGLEQPHHDRASEANGGGDSDSAEFEDPGEAQSQQPTPNVLASHLWQGFEQQREHFRPRLAVRERRTSCREDRSDVSFEPDFDDVATDEETRPTHEEASEQQQPEATVASAPGVVLAAGCELSRTASLGRQQPGLPSVRWRAMQLQSPQIPAGGWQQAAEGETSGGLWIRQGTPAGGGLQEVVRQEKEPQTRRPSAVGKEKGKTHDNERNERAAGQEGEPPPLDREPASEVLDGKLDKHNASTKVEEDGYQLRFTFQPGCVGMIIHRASGMIEAVAPGGQAAAVGVKQGWQIVHVNIAPYSAEDLDECVLGSEPYSLHFRKAQVSDQALLIDAKSLPSLSAMAMETTRQKVIDLRMQLTSLSICCDELESVVLKNDFPIAGLVQAHAHAMQRAACQLDALATDADLVEVDLDDAPVGVHSLQKLDFEVRRIQQELEPS